MITLSRIKRVNWAVIATTICAGAILHIAATLAAPGIATAPAVTRLERAVPLNALQIMPPVTASTQPLPFMSPDARYAMCRFDSSQGTVAISATLPEPGWALSLHSKDGENFYTAVAQPGRAMEVSLLLIPMTERFTGLTNEAKGKASAASIDLTLVAREGLAILRAPDKGYAYRPYAEAIMAGAKCGLRKSP